MDSPPAGKNSEMATWIAKHFNTPKCSTGTIKKVIVDVWQCTKDGTEYTGEKSTSSRITLVLVPFGSPAARIIAN